MIQISYTPENPPKVGTAKKIWDTLIANGFTVDELHWNPGPKSVNGTGTWACEAVKGDIKSRFGFFCGIIGKNAVYLQSIAAPYGEYLVGFYTRMCPFRYKHGCKYMSMNPKSEWPDGCPRECDVGTDEFLLLRNQEYAKFK